MATTVLASNTTAAVSADITIEDGASLVFVLTSGTAPSVPPGSSVAAFIKTADGYMYAGADACLNSKQPSLRVAGPITVQWRRTAGVKFPLGVDQA